MNDLEPVYQPPLPFGQALAERAVEYLQAEQSDNTLRVYASAWNDFTAFCTPHGLEPLPASPATVAAYLTYLAAGQRISTLRVKLAAISAQHRHFGHKDPAADPRVRALLRGIVRKRGMAPHRKTALTREPLFEIIAALDREIADGALSPLRGARNKALLVFTYAGMFRRGEVAALQIADLEFTSDEMIVMVRRSKTDQEGHGFKKHIPRLDDADAHAEICAVRLVRAWLRLAQLRKGPVFRSIDRYDHPRAKMSDRAIANIVKQAVKLIGLDPEEFSAHSLRAGPVTQAFLEGLEEWEVQATSGHKSRVVLQDYNRGKAEAQTRVVRKILKKPAASSRK